MNIIIIHHFECSFFFECVFNIKYVVNCLMRDERTGKEVDDFPAFKVRDEDEETC